MENKEEKILHEIAINLLEDLFNRQQYKNHKHFRIEEKTKSNLFDGLCVRIEKIVKPSFFYLFASYLEQHNALDLYLQDEKDEKLNPIKEEFSQKGSELLKEKVPLLKDKIKEVVRQYERFIDEIMEHLDERYKEVCDLILTGKHFKTIEGFSIDAGDLHNGGRSTSIIETDQGSLIYKPRKLLIDLKIKELIDRFFNDVTKAPALVLGEDYGFVEFIENKVAATEEESRKYFYALGGLTAVVDLLGSSDLHHNNILAKDGYPIIIDYELMLRPGSSFRKGLAFDLDHSLFYSSFMPSRRGDIEMSVLFATDKENRSAPIVDDRRQSIKDHPENFLQGFEDVYRRCMKQKEELKEFFLTMKDVEVRHIYRNTRTYNDLLNKTLEPNWLNDPDREKEILKHFSLALQREGDDDLTIAASETKALLRNDIPYFYTKADQKDLYSEGKVVAKDFFSQTCIDHLLSRINNFSEADLAFETSLLKRAMKGVVVAEGERRSLDEPLRKTKPRSKEEFFDKAKEIFRRIEADKIITPSGRVCRFGVDYHLQTGMELLDDGLIAGKLGIAVFAAALYKLCDDAELKLKCRTTIEEIVEGIEKQIAYLSEAEKISANSENTSFSDGLAGKLLGLHLIGTYLEEPKYFTLCEKIIELIPKLDLRYEKNDVINGTAGLLKALCRYDDLFAINETKKICEKLADHLLKAATIDYKGRKLWRTGSARWPISGAGHGQSGIAAALSAAGKRLGRNDLMEAAEAGFVFEDEFYSGELKVWRDVRSSRRSDSHICGYCSGAPGIGMNALQNKSDLSKDLLNKAMESVENEGLLYKDILCCGNCSIIEFLLQAGRINEAQERMAAVLDREKRIGHFHYYNEGLSYVYSPSLLYGEAGIGYTILRLLDPKQIESVLL
ncbi:MAG: type 2 lantipeptide synthetase LanM [Erysipelotrichaceae bacterium]|nr:type 2 lantipeptide synthetase LanM [Erysipelotrichaceae bacterium]